MADVLVPLADGCEELEAVTVIDLLRRAKVNVVTASLANTTITASRGVRIIADMTLEQALLKDYDMVVLPGGMPGADHLDNDERLAGLLQKMADSGKYTAAICAAPKVLASKGILKGKRATSFPGVLEAMQPEGVTLTADAVVIDGKVITSRGPGTAMDFALTLIDVLQGSAVRQQVEAGLQRA